ncbi:YncE family protein [Streptacidiphilus anmyonensis]|uniref:YncE family protein n=1 Tax=Streptacidiphilus anmyonensis TaxID=405782 RepID=UPI0005A8B9A4|nr:hypothetical protein [Streptacidiphilus anmyonensis]
MRHRTSTGRSRAAARVLGAAAVVAALSAAALSAGGVVPAFAATTEAAPAAQADTTVTLPIAGLAGKVVDAAHGHLFISDGVSQILVTDLAGHTVGTIGSEPGAGGMTLSPDGDTLYVADSWNDATPLWYGAIAAIDTRTLRETARYPLPRNTQPSSLAFTGGKLWFSYQVVGQDGGIGAVDPGAATPTATVGLAQELYGGAPGLAANPGAPDQLVAVGGTGRVGAPTIVHVYDVSQGTGGALPPSPGGYPLDGATDLTMNPDGSEFVVAGSDADIFGLTGTFFRGQYGVASTGFGWTSAAVAPGGAAAIGGGTHNDVRQIEVHPQDDRQPVNTYTLPLDEQLRPSGLAWSPDAGTLYAFTESDHDTHLLLHLIQGDPTHAATTARLGAPASVQAGRSFTVSGALDSAHSFTSGAPVRITRTSSVDHKTVSLPAQTASILGRYQFTDTLPAAGSYTYTAAFAGDVAHEPATVSATVQATGVVPALSVRTDAVTYDQGATARVTAHLGATDASRNVAIYAQPADGSPRKLVASGDVDAQGNLTAAYKVSVDTTFTAAYGGDAVDSPASATTVVGVRIGLRETLSGGYATARYGATAYAVFHHTAALRLALQTTPVKEGNCLTVQVQQYVSGAWRTRTTVACVATHLGKAAYVLSLRGLPVGGMFRIAACWTPPRGEFNVATTGSWQYFTVRR